MQIDHNLQSKILNEIALLLRLLLCHLSQNRVLQKNEFETRLFYSFFGGCYSLKSNQVMVPLHIFPIFSFLAKMLSFLLRDDNIFAWNENIGKICKRTIKYQLERTLSFSVKVPIDMHNGTMGKWFHATLYAAIKS